MHKNENYSIKNEVITMLHQIKKSLPLFLISAVILMSQGLKADENKRVTKIFGISSADGKSTVTKELLEECIVALPKANDLAAEINSKTQFMKGIGGDESKKEHVKTYEAIIEINYMLYQKELIIITTNSVESTKPILEEKELRIKQSKTFKSNSDNGDKYAGRSRRQYYFSSEAAAVKDAKKRAKAWLKSQSAVVCAGK